MTFSVIDIIFAVILVIFAFTAWHRGFISEVLGKLCPVVSVLVAALFFGQLAPYVVKLAPVPPALSAVVAFIFLFVATFIIIKILQTVLHGLTDAIDVLKVDKLLGLVLGALEGLLVVSAIMILFLCQSWFPALQRIVYDSLAWSLLGSLLATPVEKVQEFFNATKDSIKTGLA